VQRNAYASPLFVFHLRHFLTASPEIRREVFFLYPIHGRRREEGAPFMSAGEDVPYGNSLREIQGVRP